jgi:hypothetical protein
MTQQLLRKFALSCWLACLLLCLPLATSAAPLTLEVQGKISRTNDPNHTVYRISEAELMKLPVHTITTSTTWTPKSRFTGPLLSDVLKLVGANAEWMELRTLDDYAYTVSVTEAEKYGAILAYSMNGKRLEISDFGPLFLIYPRDTYPAELTGSVGDAKFVWQIKALLLQ